MISYEVFMKHADKVCKNSLNEVRPILSGVKHLENGDAVCTDSHRLYLAKNIHDRTDGAVITPAGKKIDGSYPEVSRLIPDSLDAKQSLKIDVNDLLKTADMIASVGTIIEEKPALEFKEDMIVYKNFEVKIGYTFYPLTFTLHICANAIYVLDALKLLKATGCQTVTVNFYGAMRPFTLVNEDESLLALILPIRKY
jgi:hypothetical protein